MTTYTVGTHGQFGTIEGAVAASAAGDTVQVAAGTYTNDFVTITHDLTLQAVGGQVNMVATVSPPNGKAILDTSGNVTITGFAFSGAVVGDGNGAGIRYESGNLTLNDDYFHNNQDGLLANPSATGNITINSSEFGFNGAGDGYTHNLYVGAIASLTIDNSYFHDAIVGHEIKSRAAMTTITNTRIQDGPTGTASYSVDLPNGGVGLIQNDVIQQGPQSQNPVIIAYGEEGNLLANSTLSVTGNTILNDLSSPSTAAVWNASTAPVSLTNNSTFGLTAAQLVRGTATVSGTTVLATEPPLDTSSPQNAANVSGGTTDTLVLNLSEDAWMGDAMFSVQIDGTTLGQPQTVTALHKNQQQQAFTFHGNFGPGTHQIGVTFLNDAWGGTTDTDRNLYVNSISLDGTSVPNSAATIYADGTATFSSAPPADSPTPDSLVVNVAEDAWMGDAQFNITIDGKTLGQQLSVTASHAMGQSQAFTFNGSFGAGTHQVGISFINDAWGGTAATDRNLYVNSISLDGATAPSSNATLFANGTSNFSVPSPGSAGSANDTLVLHLSEDMWQGDAQFVASVDGKSLGPAQSVTALHSAGKTQDFTFQGSFGPGNHDLAVSFLNDAWGGTAATDRNLYVNGATLDGTSYPAAAATLFITSTVHFQIGAQT